MQPEPSGSDEATPTEPEGDDPTTESLENTGRQEPAFEREADGEPEPEADSSERAAAGSEAASAGCDPAGWCGLVEARSSSVEETDDTTEAIAWLVLALLLQDTAGDDQEVGQELADLIAGD